MKKQIFNINDKVKIINSWDDKLFNKIGVIIQCFYNTNEYLIEFNSLGRAILHETEFIIFNEN